MKKADDINLRRARPTEIPDARGILEVHRRAIRTTAAPFYSAEIVAEWGAFPITEEMVSRFIQSKGKDEIITVAEQGGRIVGFSEVVPANNELRAVYIDPAFGRVGLGARLLASAEQEARKMSCKRLELHSSLNAKAFYERNGYRVLRPDEHVLRSGRKMSCFVMEKNL